jgi:hypothetical protein
MKELGKIKDVKFGIVSGRLGIHFELEFGGCGCSKSVSEWDYNQVEWDEHCKWVPEDRDSSFVDTMKYVSDLLSQAKVEFVEDLKNIPIEVEHASSLVISFRILTEVL